jgi:hypothetical protein
MLRLRDLRTGRRVLTRAEQAEREKQRARRERRRAEEANRQREEMQAEIERLRRLLGQAGDAAERDNGANG